MTVYALFPPQGVFMNRRVKEISAEELIQQMYTGSVSKIN